MVGEQLLLWCLETARRTLMVKKIPYFSKCTYTIIHSFCTYSFVQMKHTHTHRASSLHSRTLFLSHTFAEGNESFVIPGTVWSTSGAHSPGLTPSSPLWKVCSLIEHDDIYIYMGFNTIGSNSGDPVRCLLALSCPILMVNKQI